MHSFQILIMSRGWVGVQTKLSISVQIDEIYMHSYKLFLLVYCLCVSDEFQGQTVVNKTHSLFHWHSS